MDHSGQAVVTAPYWLSEDRLQEFIARHQDWIKEKQQYYQRLTRLLPEISLSPGALFLYRGQFLPLAAGPQEPGLYLPEGNLQKYFRQLAAQLISKHLDELALRHRFNYQYLVIKKLKSTWGSCSPDNTLTFNYRIIFAPPPLLEYLLIHELVHTRFHNHSRNYWQTVAQIIPDYQARRRYLNALTPALFLWADSVENAAERNKNHTRAAWAVS